MRQVAGCSFTWLVRRFMLLVCNHAVKDLLILNHLSLQVLDRAVVRSLLLFATRR